MIRASRSSQRDLTKPLVLDSCWNQICPRHSLGSRSAHPFSNGISPRQSPYGASPRFGCLDSRDWVLAQRELEAASSGSNA